MKTNGYYTMRSFPYVFCQRNVAHACKKITNVFSAQVDVTCKEFGKDRPNNTAVANAHRKNARIY